MSMNTTDSSMAGKICMITGANSGIGKETALGLAKAGATVVMVSRNPSKGRRAQDEIKQLSGNPSIDLFLADLSSLQSVRQLAADFQQKYHQLHVLINNAGGVFTVRRLSVDGIEKTLAVNYLSVFLLTDLLLDTLKASAPARIINVSSDIHYSAQIDLDDLPMAKQYSTLKAYGRSKLALVLFTYELAKRLEGTGVTANCLHPGVVATNIWSQPLPEFLRPLITLISKRFGIPAEEGAQTSLYLATSPEVAGVNGKYFEKCKEKSSARLSYDPVLQQRLWEISEELTREKINTQ